MLIVGSDDGLYRIDAMEGAERSTAKKVHDTGRVRRVRTFQDRPGVFAATKTGLFHSVDGAEWVDLAVPQTNVYAIRSDERGKKLFAGTRPAHLFVAEIAEQTPPYEGLDWKDLDSFRDRAEQSEWQLPRHKDTAQVRDIIVTPDEPDRIVTGIEVGGVHVSTDGGATWSKRDGADDDIHELHAVGSAEFVAATGFGLFRTTDAGRSWTRLDTDYDQRYFRAVCSVDGTLYAAGALKNSSTWNDAAADPELFISSDRKRIEPLPHPRPSETVTGITGVDGEAVVATHRGTVLRRRSNEWEIVGTFPVPGSVTGRYTPLVSVDK